jgi:choline dehydrogenase-like flavoprotein
VNYVVGSGPAGVACAHALVSRGVPVTMLDAGVEMEPDLRRVLATMSGQAPADWDAGDRARIKRPTEISDRAIPLKAAYGSLFPYQHAAQRLRFDTNGVDAAPSFARGGFSNVWGATVLPYLARDISDWPIAVADLTPHYAAIAGLMTLSERRDRLSAQFPLFTKVGRALEPSQQAAALMRDLEANADVLEADGWRFGYSRLAVAVPGAARGCVYCGMCLYGCPYGFIYNSNATLDQLRRSDCFSYTPGVVVTRVDERGGAVRIQCESRQSGESLRFVGDRVFLAAGTFNTTAVLLASLDAFDAPVTMQDSQLFLVPTVRYRGVPAVTDEHLFTLSQIFVQLDAPALSTRTLFVQVYTYNDWYVEAIRRRVGPLYPLAKPWVNAVLARLIVCQGYLPSDLSPRITATLRKTADGHTLSLEAQPNRASQSAISHVVAALRRHRRELRAVALTPLMEVGAPGRGYHTGGSFPMRDRPGPFESDRWGRPQGFERVHVVDASVFPSIPAGPITFSVMANAHRIGSAAADG